MAAEVGVSVSAVRRIWKAHGLQPHRWRAFKLSNDPQFVANRFSSLQNVPETVAKLKNMGPSMPDDEDALSVSRIMSRAGTIVTVIALASHFLWEMLSESAALSRLSATAAIFHYPERCDANGNPIATGQPNCVDLNRCVFVHGPINRAFRRAYTGKEAGILSFEEGKVPRSEINAVQKELQYWARSGASSPC